MHIRYMELHSRPVARLTERGMHTKNKWASGHLTYIVNLMHFKLNMLVLKYSYHTRLLGGQRLYKFGW